MSSRKSGAKVPSGKTKILLVDDHVVVLEGIKKLISEQPDFEVVGTASDGMEAIRKAQALKPDIVIMDIGMPGMDGIQATHEIKKWDNRIRVVIFTMYADGAHAVSLFREGVSAYVLKADPISDLFRALRAVRDGGTYFSAVINDSVRQHMESLEHSDDRSAGGVQNGLSLLSAREKEVFPLLADGKSIREIAQILFISPKTVETHKYNIMQKLGVDSIADLTKIALRKKIIQL
jgi:DNA-binding NarL/FixJ family response regulator